MKSKYLLSMVLVFIFVSPAFCETTEELSKKVSDVETAFAKTMADRDFEGFVSFLSEEAVFFGGKSARRGKATVAAAWKYLYDGPAAPFSWKPEKVEVLDSGTLALSTGPVFTPDGKQSGTYSSIWRLEADGKWRIIFDQGCPACNCPEK